MDYQGKVVAFLTGLVVMQLVVGVAAADTSVSSTTTYNGTDGESQQIQVQVTVSPDVVTENLSVRFLATQNSFIRYQSFQRGQPDGVTIRNPATGQYVIDELSPGEEVVFQFVAYPRQINTQSLNIAQVRTSSDQNPNEQRTMVTANLSSSPYLQLQDAQARNQALQTRIATMRAGFWGGLGVGVIGLVVAGLLVRKARSMVPESEVCDDLSSIRTGVSGDSNEQVVERYMKDYDCDTGGGGVPGVGGSGYMDEGGDTGDTTSVDEAEEPGDGTTGSDDDDIGPIV